MTKTLSIRELTRGGKMLLEYDYIDIEDKKSHQYKGVFVSKRYAEEVKKFIDKKIAHEQDKRKELILQFAGLAAGDIGEKSIQDILKEKNL